ncbi:MAG TPA: ABC transporter ATP-binding protein [Chloroflexota bacterium]|nr:ABC transporter ATP-binding protein [Chloroflexota bacterium]HUM70522.1 ABC transporter ATP-binding protein [Chloroflexota bacterium]
MITVENLTYTYVGTAVPAVQHLSFEVEPGEILGFLGPSGAGKSTTQKVLNGLYKGYAGSVRVRGKEVRQWGSDYYEHIGVSFELPNHYQKLTARENLNYFRNLYSGDTYEPQALLEMVGLGADGDMLVSQYSKGMKNRLGVARALLHRPDLLFLDEPTSGLDPVNARHIKELIRAQKGRGATVFLTTHDMFVADELCDRVAFIMDGQIRLIDSPRALKLQYGRAQVQVEFQLNGHLEWEQFALTGLGENGRFQKLLQSDSIQTMHTQEATLDDIFIAVTGRGLQ